MLLNENDPVKILQQQKSYHLDQIRRIDIALDALQKDEKGEAARKTRVRWSAEIRKLFEENPDSEMNFSQVRHRLLSRGITQAGEKRGGNTVMSTLSRLKSDGFLIRSDVGTYRKRSKNDPETGLFRE